MILFGSTAKRRLLSGALLLVMADGFWCVPAEGFRVYGLGSRIECAVPGPKTWFPIIPFLGVSHFEGYLFGGLHGKDVIILGCMLAFPLLG